MPALQNLNQPPGIGGVTGGAPLAENPIVVSSNVGTAVAGTSAGHVGVSGRSVIPSRPAGVGTANSGQTSSIGSEPIDDGVYGEGKNGVHGLCTGTGATDSGVLGENVVGAGPGVTGTSVRSDGVYGTGTNGVHGKSASASDNGVLGENSAGGQGVTGTSVSGYGVKGTGGNCGVYGISTGPDVQNAGVWGQTSGSGPGVLAQSLGIGPGILAIANANVKLADDLALLAKGVAGLFCGGVYITEQLNGATATFTGPLNGATATFTGPLSGATATFTGAVTANDVIITGADCAEEFDVSNAEQLEPGTVVVFDGKAALSQCAEAYNKRAAGVISGAGNYRPGVVLDRRASCAGRAAVALIGKVFCKVDASYSPIELGDLLTTSPTPGCAMKAMDPVKAFGAVIGKALAPLHDGRGLIPILVTLQ